MAVVSSCREAWPWVAKRAQPTVVPLTLPPAVLAWGAGARGYQAQSPRQPPGVGVVAEVKSIWPISVGLHTCYTGGLNGLLSSKAPRPPTPPAVRIARCKPRMKGKPLVIVHQDVTVKLDQALHTPPITLGKCVWWDPPPPVPRVRGWDRLAGDLSEVDTR